MRLRIDDTTWQPDVLSSKTFVSPHTGRTLPKVKVSSKIARRKDPELRALLDKVKKEGVQSIGDDGTVQTSWSVEMQSHSYRDDEDYEWHTWELTEKENLAADRLLVHDFEIIPELYSEEVSNGSIVIHAVTTFTEERGNKFAELRTEETLKVVREGVSSTPLDMRFGHCAWARADDMIRQAMVLIQIVDDEEPNALSDLFGRLWHVRDVQAAWTESNRRLLELLESKGVISEQEREEVTTITPLDLVQSLQNFEQRDNLDDWIELYI